jgi:hypothetical protein
MDKRRIYGNPFLILSKWASPSTIHPRYPYSQLSPLCACQKILYNPSTDGLFTSNKYQHDLFRIYRLKTDRVEGQLVASLGAYYQYREFVVRWKQSRLKKCQMLKPDPVVDTEPTKPASTYATPLPDWSSKQNMKDPVSPTFISEESHPWNEESRVRSRAWNETHNTLLTQDIEANHAVNRNTLPNNGSVGTPDVFLCRLNRNICKPQGPS